jgi:hypothetical protein
VALQKVTGSTSGGIAKVHGVNCRWHCRRSRGQLQVALQKVTGSTAGGIAEGHGVNCRWHCRRASKAIRRNSLTRYLTSPYQLHRLGITQVCGGAMNTTVHCFWGEAHCYRVLPPSGTLLQSATTFRHTATECHHLQAHSYRVPPPSGTPLQGVTNFRHTATECHHLQAHCYRV